MNSYQRQNGCGCIICKKPLKRDLICKKCSQKPWHEVDKAYAPYALMYFKRKERFLKYILTHAFYPTRLEGAEYSDGNEAISEDDKAWHVEECPKSVNDVAFISAYNMKDSLALRKKMRKEDKLSLNAERDEDEKKCPKCTNMKRACGICRVKKPLDYKHFHWRRFMGYLLDGNELNDLQKRKYLGVVCRECYDKQKKAAKELKRLGINIGGLIRRGQYSEKNTLMFLSMGRTLVEAKTKKRELRHESNHTNVYGKQFENEGNNKGRLPAG